MAKKSAPAEPLRPARFPDAWPLAVVSLSFLHGAIESWEKLGELMVDSGRELDLPRRMLEGAALYTDVRYYWGPFAPVLNWLLYRAFGVSLDTLRVAGLCSAALMCLALYLLGRHFLGRWVATSAVVAFVYLGAFAHLGTFAIFNFVLPFNFSATWGIVAATFSVHLLLTHQRTQATAPWLGSAALLGVAALTKIEVLTATAVAHAAFALTTGRALRRVHLGGWALAAAIPAAAYGTLYARVGHALWAENLGALVSPASRHYVNRTMGLLDLGESFAAIGVSMLVLGGAALAAWVASRRPSVGLTASAAVLVFLGVNSQSPDVPTRALVVLLAAGLLLAAFRWWKDRTVPRAQAVVLWAFGLSCLARIALRAIPSHYGFYLLPPALVCAGVALSENLPELFSAVGPRRQPFVAVAVALLLGMAVSGYRLDREWYAAHSVELTTARGTLRVTAAAPEPRLLAALKNFPPGTTLATIPQGAGLIYASGLSPSDPVFSYLPMELPDAAADQALLARWQSKPPDVLVWWRMNQQKSFGVQGFGIDYATATGQWVTGHYHPVTDPKLDHVVLVSNARAANAAGH